MLAVVEFLGLVAYEILMAFFMGAFHPMENAKKKRYLFLALFPHFFAYVPAYLGLVELSGRRREHTGWRRITAVLFLLTVLFVGILLESYANPLILQKVLKIF